MRSKASFALIAVVAVVGLAVPAAAGEAVATRVTIHGPEGDFYGRVKSDKASCIKNRKVKVFKIKKGGPEKIAADISNNEGRWSVGTTGYKNGRFYARAPSTDTCKAGTSETIRLIDGVEQ